MANSRFAGDSLADVEIETVHFPSGDTQINGYLAKPNGEAKRDAIVLIYDEEGLNESVRNTAQKFAQEGFVTLVPELLSRSGGTSAMKSSQEVKDALSHLSTDTTLRDLSSAVSFLAARPDVTPKRISAVGLGWGGWRAFLLAGETELHRVVVYSASTPTEGLEDLQCPIQAHYGQFDFRNAGNALWTEKILKGAGKQFTYYIYPGADRDFFEQASAEYDAEAAKQAWARAVEFLR